MVKTIQAMTNTKQQTFSPIGLNDTKRNRIIYLKW